MNVFEWVESKMGNLNWYDYSILKLSVFFFTLFLVVVWQAFHDFVFTISWYWYLALWVIMSLYLLNKLLK